MPTNVTNAINARNMAFLRLRAEDPKTYNNPDTVRVDGKHMLVQPWNEIASQIERNYMHDVVRVKNTSGGTWTAPYLLKGTTLALTTQTTAVASNNPSAGTAVVILLAATFEVGQIVEIVSGGFTEFAIVTAVSAGMSVTVDILGYAHTTPTVTALPAYEAIAANASDAKFADWVIDLDILNNGYGTAYAFREITAIDTSAFTVEAELFLDTAAGQFTETVPAGDKIGQVVAVVKVSNAGAGILQAFPGAKDIRKIASSMVGGGGSLGVIESRIFA